MSANLFPHLLSPFEIRGRELRNRIVSTPHATGWSRDGLIDRSEVDYHVRKAAGGCGLVMTFGSASVDPSTEASYGSVALWDERNEPALRALADGVHEHGGLVMSQMTHMGRRGTSAISGIPLRAPSDLPEGVHMEVPVPLATDELPAIVERFADVARRLERCGLDGAEVTSYGGHLLEQFFDPLVNTRTDAYGGSLENRTRFAREVLLAVRAAVSDRFIVGFRMTLDQCLTGGLGPDEMIEIARSLASTGASRPLQRQRRHRRDSPVDRLLRPRRHAARGRLQRAGDPVPARGRRAHAGRGSERRAGRWPSRCSPPGSTSSAMTRAIIADPDLPLKIADGRRHRPCIGLNDGCIGRLYTGMPMYCSVNPAIRHPGLADVVPAEEPARVVVVGGGVAGLEAARAAALRGHEVVLFERRSGARRSSSTGRDSGPGETAGIDTSTGCARRPRRRASRSAWASTRTLGPSWPKGPTLSSSRRGRSSGPMRGLPGPVPVLDVDALLEGGATILPDPALGSALILDDDGQQLAPTAAEMLVAAGFEVEIATTHPVGRRPHRCHAVAARAAEAGARWRAPHAERCGRVELGGDAVTLRHLYSEQEEQREGIALVVIAGRRRGSPRCATSSPGRAQPPGRRRRRRALAADPDGRDRRGRPGGRDDLVSHLHAPLLAASGPSRSPRRRRPTTADSTRPSAKTLACEPARRLGR